MLIFYLVSYCLLITCIVQTREKYTMDLNSACATVKLHQQSVADDRYLSDRHVRIRRLHRIGRRDSITCPHCNDADETAEHLVLQCPAHDQVPRKIQC